MKFDNFCGTSTDSLSWKLPGLHWRVKQLPVMVWWGFLVESPPVSFWAFALSTSLPCARRLLSRLSFFFLDLSLYFLTWVPIAHGDIIAFFHSLNWGEIYCESLVARERGKSRKSENENWNWNCNWNWSKSDVVKGPSGEPGSLTDAVCEPDIENSNENIIYKKKICEKREKKNWKIKRTHIILIVGSGVRCSIGPGISWLGYWSQGDWILKNYQESKHQLLRANHGARQPENVRGEWIFFLVRILRILHSFSPPLKEPTRIQYDLMALSLLRDALSSTGTLSVRAYQCTWVKVLQDFLFFFLSLLFVRDII